MPLLHKINIEILHAMSYLQDETFQTKFRGTELTLSSDDEKIVDLVYFDLTIAGTSHRKTIPVSILLKSPMLLSQALIKLFMEQTSTLDETTRSSIEKKTTIDIGVLFRNLTPPENTRSITTELKKRLHQKNHITNELTKIIAYLSPKLSQGLLKNAQAHNPNYFVVRIQTKHEAPIYRRSLQFNYSIGCDLVKLSSNPDKLTMRDWQSKKLHQNHPAYALFNNQLYYVITSPYQFSLHLLKALSPIERHALEKLFPTLLDSQENASKKALSYINLITGHDGSINGLQLLNCCIKEITTLIGPLNTQKGHSLEMICGLNYPNQHDNGFTPIIIEEPEQETSVQDEPSTANTAPEHSPGTPPISISADAFSTTKSSHYFFNETVAKSTKSHEDSEEPSEVFGSLRISSV